MTSRSLAAAALVVVLGTALIDACFGVEVTFVLPPQDASAVAVGHEPGDDPARRYGVPIPGPAERVLLWDRAQLVTPPEAPSRRLLVLDATLERPRAARTLWFVALALVVPLVVGAWALRARQGASPRAP